MKSNFIVVSLQNTQKWLTEQRKLAKQTDEVDYDVEGKIILISAVLHK